MTEIEHDTIKAVGVACRTVMSVDADMPLEIQTALLKLAARELPAQEAPSAVGPADEGHNDGKLNGQARHVA